MQTSTAPIKKLVDKRHIHLMTILFILVYFVSYLTRKDLSVVMVDMIQNEENLTKSLLGMVVAINSITYGVGQLVSGFLGDRIHPRKLIFFGLLVTSGMNALVPVASGSIEALTVLWCVNGFAQAMMWPPLVKIMAERLPDSDYNTACVKVSWGSSAATIALYLLSPLWIRLFGWRLVFVISALCGLGMAGLWLFGEKRLERYADAHGQGEPTEERESLPKSTTGKKAGIRQLCSVTLLLVMAGIILQGFLRDGITDWMPTYIQESFSLESGVSILVNVVLPIFSIFAFSLASLIQRKWFQNEMTCSAVIFAVGALAALALSFLYSANVALSVGLAALVTGCMHGVNLILICVLPKHFRKFGNISFVSGLLNFCTYIGAALAQYGFGTLSTLAGWHGTILIWAAVAALGALVCFLGARGWRKFRE